MTAHMILFIIALVCWFLAAIQQPTWPNKISLGWLGMFFYGLTLLVK